jgi:hypothetical protein
MVLLGSSNTGQEKTERRKAQPIASQIITPAQEIIASQPEAAQRPKTTRRNVQATGQPSLQTASKSVKTLSRKAKQNNMPPPTKAQLLKSFAGRIQ